MLVEGPFLIRAHHLTLNPDLFTLADAGKLTMINLAKLNERTFFGKIQPAHMDNEYLRDVLGPEPRKYMPTYNQRILDYFDTFYSLPYTAVISIIREKDGICAACAIGRHCENSQDIEAETEDLQAFALKANAHWGLTENEDFSVIYEGQKMTRIETTKGVVVQLAWLLEQHHNLGVK